MFSCSHFSNFLSDPIGKAERHVKLEDRMRLPVKVHPWQSPEPSVPAKARQINLVLHSTWSARENPSQYLGYPGNPGNDDKGQGDLTRTRKLVQTTQNPEVERYQVKRQENAQSSDSWKQYNQEESSHSTGTRKLVQVATPRTEFQKLFTKHQYTTKIFHFLLKKL